jgi:hypothetical protein
MLMYSVTVGFYKTELFDSEEGFKCIGNNFHEETFDDVVGHQVGNGYIQLLFNDGRQKILKLEYADIIPSEEDRAAWLKQSEVAKTEYADPQETQPLNS